MNTINYLEKCKAKLGIKSDNELAIWLKITRQTVSNYQLGKSKIDNYTAARVAEKLGVNPMLIVATANAEREKNAVKREYWARMAHRLERAERTKCPECKAANDKASGPFWGGLANCE